MDPPDRPGLAYWLAKMLDTDLNVNWSVSIWNRVMEVRRMGGSISAWTTGRSTIFRNTGLSMYADGLLWQLHWFLESGEVAKSLSLSKKIIAKLREADKKTNKRERTPDDVYNQALLSGLFGAAHPYAVARDSRSFLMKLKAAELEAFRDNNYGGAGATLVVTGKFDTEKVRKQIKSLYSSWPSQGASASTIEVPDAQARKRPQRSIVVDEDIRHPEVTVAFSTSRGLLHKRPARLVVESMVEQRVSAVREELGASYGVAVDYDFNEGPGSLVITGTVNRAKASEALKLIQSNLKQLREGTAIRDDFVRARRRVLARHLADSASATEVANKIATEASYDLPTNFDQSLAADIANLTVEEVKAQLAADLAIEKEVLIVRSPGKVGKAMFSDTGLTDYVTLKP